MSFVVRVLGCAVVMLSCVLVGSIVRGQTGGPIESPFSDGTVGETKAAERPPAAGSAQPAAEKAASAPAADDDFCQCIGGSLGSNSEMVKKIERALKAPLQSNGFEFSETPLHDVVAFIQDAYGIPIQIDRMALDSAGIRSDEQISVNIHRVTLGAALRLLLKSVGLTYDIQDEVLLFTTPEEAEKRLRICVYNVGGIVGSEPQLDAVIDMLQSCVATETWSENGGGEAEIRAIKPGLLVVSQTAQIHEQIRELLATLQRVRGQDSPAFERADTLNPAAGAEVVTRAYNLQLTPTDDIDTMRSQIRELITGALPDEAWSGRLGDGQSVTLTVFHDRVVVRQTPEVQEKLARILADSGVATPAPTGTANAAMGFGGEGGFGGGGGGFGSGGGGRSGGAGEQGGGFFSKGLEKHWVPAQNGDSHQPNPFE